MISCRLLDNSSFFTPYWIWCSQLVRYSVKAVSTGFSIPIFHDTFTFGDAVLTLVLFYPKRNFQLTERGENLFSRSQERRSKMRWLVVHFRGRFSLKFSCLLFVRYFFLLKTLEELKNLTMECDTVLKTCRIKYRCKRKKDKSNILPTRLCASSVITCW